MKELFVSGGISLAITYVLTFPLRTIGLRYGIVDMPTARSSHRKPTVRIGGPAIFVGTVVGLMFGWRTLAEPVIASRNIAALIGGGTIIVAASFADDLFGLKAQYRLFAQVLAAVVFVGLAGGLRWIDLPATERIMLGPVGLPLTILWLVAWTNILNFMDGIDGLAAGVTAIACVFVVIAARITDNPSVGLYAAVLAGSAAGFLMHNFPPAKIFMGDAGSTFLGFMVGGIAVIGSGADQPERAIPLLMICLMLAAFLFDAAMTMLRRVARKDSLFEPHRDYLFHTAVQLGLSHRTVALTEYALAAILGASGILYLKLPGAGSWSLVLFWTAALILLAERIDVQKRRHALPEVVNAASGGAPITNASAPTTRTRDSRRSRRADRVTIVRPPSYKAIVLLVLLDLCLCTASYYTAFVANFVGFTPEFYEFIPAFYRTVWLMVPCRLLAFWAFGLYRKAQQRGRTQVLFDALRAVAASTLLAALLIWAMTRFRYYPRAVLVIDSLFVVYFVGFVRFVLSIRRERPARAPAPVPERLLIVGAGKAAASMVRELNSNPQLGYVPVGLVDDDPDKQDRRVHGVPVRGSVDRLPQLAREYEIDQILIAIRFPTRSQINRIVDRCIQSGADFRIVPSARESGEEFTSIVRSRNVNVLDLFGREPVAFNADSISRWLAGKTVLVTGAGGCLGSELCRQIAPFEPAALVLLDHNEQGIYETGLKLETDGTHSAWTAIVTDVNDRDKLYRTFETYRPEIVVHLAGINNVEVAETNCDETVLVNVIGSRNVLECADRMGSARVILASSNRAADPASVVGCTKRIAELLARQFDSGTTCAAAVRLGDVVEDRGSVVALFERQIAMGGPITIPHPDMMRCFLKATDAAQLLLSAAEMATAGRLYYLDSGDPVRVMSLAERLIHLSGLQPHRDVQIKVSGVRPGDKISETPIGQNESRVATSHPRIFEIRSEQPSEQGDLNMNLDKLERFARDNDVPGMLRIMREMVPEFQPAQSPDKAGTTGTG